MTQRHWVYRCYDDSKRLLYVGITSQGVRRFDHGHSRTAAWWEQVATIEIQHVGTRQEAEELETALIRGLQPPHNSAKRRTKREMRAALLGAGPCGKYVTLELLAERMGVHTATVEAFMECGMPHRLLAGSPRFAVQEIADWLIA